MVNKSHYDIIDNYKFLLLSLLDETNTTANKYGYDDFIHDADYSISYIRNTNWFLEGLCERIELERKGIKEHKSLRKGSKNYYTIYRQDGQIKKVVSFVDGEEDVTYYAVYTDNKRYLIPFSDKYQNRYYTYTIVTEYSEDRIIREYMVNNVQIVFYEYDYFPDSKVSVKFINYIPKSQFPVNGCEEGIISKDKSYIAIASYKGYDEYNCYEKNVVFDNQILPRFLKRIV